MKRLARCSLKEVREEKGVRLEVFLDQGFGRCGRPFVLRNPLNQDFRGCA